MKKQELNPYQIGINSGLVFAVLMFLFDYFISAKTKDIATYVIMGVLFGLMFGVFMHYMNKKKK